MITTRTKELVKATAGFTWTFGPPIVGFSLFFGLGGQAFYDYHQRQKELKSAIPAVTPGHTLAPTKPQV